MCISPLMMLDEIWNRSAPVILAGSIVKNSLTPDHPQLSVPPLAAWACRIPARGMRCMAVSVPAAAMSRSAERRLIFGPLISCAVRPNNGC